jgi:hypothetical protein
VELDLRSLSSAQVKLIAGPDASRKFALLQTGEDATTANFVPNNPRVAPFLPEEDTGYRLIPGGLKEGAVPYGDRKYKIQKLNPLLSGLPLLQTKSAHKAIVDSRYSVNACSAFSRALRMMKSVTLTPWRSAATLIRVSSDAVARS